MSKGFIKKNRLKGYSQLKLCKQSTYKFQDTVCQLNRLNCKGKSKINIYVKNKLLIEANYDSDGKINYEGVQAPDRRYENEFIDYSFAIIEPYRHGKWTYYDKNGLILKVEVWDKGILTIE